MSDPEVLQHALLLTLLSAMGLHLAIEWVEAGRETKWRRWRRAARGERR